MRGAAVIALLAFILVGSALAGNDGCKFTTPDKKYKYDVSKLIGKGKGTDKFSGFYQATDSFGQQFIYNVCEGVSVQGGNCVAGSAGCQKDQTDTWWKIGALASTKASALSEADGGAGKGFKITYGQGDEGWCSTTDNLRTFTVTFRCDAKASDPVISTVAEDQACVYGFSITSKYACPGAGGSDAEGGLSLGSLLLILILVGVVVYIGAGYAWNVKKLQKPVGESFPNIEFWKELPKLTKDGFMFVLNKTIRRGSGSSYQEV